jgi:hypothetical protein
LKKTIHKEAEHEQEKQASETHAAVQKKCAKKGTNHPSETAHPRTLAAPVFDIGTLSPRRPPHVSYLPPPVKG